jgi:putative hydrolase of the HAD superfamily
MPFSDKHIFFDLDRTLWDFDANSHKAIHQIFHEEGLQDLLDFNTFHDTYVKVNARLWHDYGQGIISKEVLRTLRFHETLKVFNLADEKLGQRIGDAYVELSPRQTQLFPNTLETLKDLKEIGFNMHIITNGFQEVQFIKLENSGLRDFFDVIVCSEFVGKNKPDPDIFHYALHHAKTSSEKSLMIGDDFRADIIGAGSIGMDAILFDPHKTQQNKHTHTIHDLQETVDLAMFLLSNRHH